MLPQASESPSIVAEGKSLKLHATADLEEDAAGASGLSAASEAPSLPPWPAKDQTGSELWNSRKRPPMTLQTLNQ